MSRPKPKAERECRPCTACCDGWVRITVAGHEARPGRPCPHSTGSGCDDYLHRPQDPCVNFVCGWRIAGSPLPDWMKPSEARVIVLFGKTQWNGLPVDLALPVGLKVPPRALQWLKTFAQQQGRPLLYTEQVREGGQFTGEQTVYGFGPPDFQEQAAHWSADGVPSW